MTHSKRFSLTLLMLVAACQPIPPGAEGVPENNSALSLAASPAQSSRRNVMNTGQGSGAAPPGQWTVHNFGGHEPHPQPMIRTLAPVDWAVGDQTGLRIPSSQRSAHQFGRGHGDARTAYQAMGGTFGLFLNTRASILDQGGPRLTNGQVTYTWDSRYRPRPFAGGGQVTFSYTMRLETAPTPAPCNHTSGHCTNLQMGSHLLLRQIGTDVGGIKPLQISVGVITFDEREYDLNISRESVTGNDCYGARNITTILHHGPSRFVTRHRGLSTTVPWVGERDFSYTMSAAQLRVILQAANADLADRSVHASCDAVDPRALSEFPEDWEIVYAQIGSEIAQLMPAPAINHTTAGWSVRAPQVTQATLNLPPRGNLEHASATQIAGWAFDPNGGPGNVHFLVDGVWAGGCSTRVARPDVSNAFGVRGVHGFRCDIRPQFRNGRVIQVFVLDDANASPHEVNGSPWTLR